ncbi:LysR family transcriptional regulator, partial [Sutterella massiliensis]|nr:LysR family transcriptional regulator [Sutterella massiliensis]
YSRELQAAFAKFEDEASLIVGLPPDEHRLDRERIFRT